MRAFFLGVAFAQTRQQALQTVLWIEIAILVMLLAGSFFFAMVETALLSTDKARVKAAAQEDSRAAVLLRLLQDPERFVTTILVGNNIVNIAAATLATAISIELWGATGAAIAAIATTAIVLVFGEITPKTLAVQRSTTIALKMARPVAFFQKVLHPFSILFSAVAGGVLRIFGVEREKRSLLSQEEIQTIVQEGVEEGEVEHFENQVIQEVFEFTETPIEEVMTPRKKVHYVQSDAPLTVPLDLAARTGHSRFPVVKGDFDNVIGFVHAKDLLPFKDHELRNTKVTETLRPVLAVDGNIRADAALHKMQRSRRLMAIVSDGKRNVGIATVEDLLEELVGEIHDEFDDAEAAAHAKERAHS